MGPQYTAIPAVGGGWPCKPKGLRGPMGKKTRKPREEEHTKVSSRGFHTLAGGERSFYLPIGYIKDGTMIAEKIHSAHMIKTDQLHKRYMHVLNMNFRLWLLSSPSAALCRYPCFPLEVANPFTQSPGLWCDTHAHLG